MSQQISIIVPKGAVRLPDNGQWANRFQIKSESSNRLYNVAQNKQSGKWGCSCPGYCIHRRCKHLTQGCKLSLSQIHGRDSLGNTSSVKEGIGG